MMLFVGFFFVLCFFSSLVFKAWGMGVGVGESDIGGLGWVD